MLKPTICSAALALSMLCLAACDKTRAGPPKPQAEADKVPAIVLTSPMPKHSITALDPARGASAP